MRPSNPYVTASARTSSGPSGSFTGSAARVTVTGWSSTSVIRP
jgi:hypothetical protein